MKRYINKISTLVSLSLIIALFAVLASCEQTSYPPNLSTAPGGGTVSKYKAYTLTAMDSKNIYGRVVFYKYSTAVTLVEIGLYNGVAGDSYTSSIYSGKAAGSGAALKPLDMVSGTTGGFATSKFFTITDAGFYDKLATYDANVVVMAGTTIITRGDIGANAAPVAQE